MEGRSAPGRDGRGEETGEKREISGADRVNMGERYEISPGGGGNEDPEQGWNRWGGRYRISVKH